MKIILFLLAMFVLTNAFSQTNVTRFTIDGKVNGFDNGTILYLYDLSDGSYKTIDSAVVKNGKFNFKGNFKQKFIRSAISTVDFSDRLTFWMEKGVTTMEAEKGSFNEAIIRGGSIQSKQNSLNKILATASDQQQAEYDFVKSNPGSILSAYILSVYSSTWNKDTVKLLFQPFAKNVKATDYGRKISDFLTFNRNVKIGHQFVDFAQRDSSGNLIKLSDSKGKIILLEFWGSWCGPCREENPSLVKMYDQFKDKGFEIFGVASETNIDQWKKAIKADGLTWKNVTDLKGSSNKAAMIYGISGYPSNFLIDKSGVIVAKDVYGGAAELVVEAFVVDQPVN